LKEEAASEAPQQYFIDETAIDMIGQNTKRLFA
jgi:hypothetical protein